MSTEQLSNDQIKTAIEDKSKDTYDLLKELPDEKELPKEDEDDELKKEDDLLKEEKPKKEEKKEEDEEIDLEEPDEEKLESITTPPKRKEILAKYPDLFKEFPYLESAYYREQQYTEIFPTLDEAKEVKERAETLEKFEGQLFNGAPDGLLQSIKEADGDAFGRIVDNLLPSLSKIDNNAYLHIIGNIGKQTIAAMVQEASTTQNEQLQAAATILHQFLFGNSQWKPPSLYGKPQQQDDASKKLADERAQFVQEKFETAKNDLETRTDNRVKSTIAQNIDPKNQMSKYVRTKAIDDCMDLVDQAIANDARFKAVLDAQWEKVFESNFSRESLDKVQSTVLSKAKSLLPELIRKARNEALSGSGKRVVDDSDDKKGSVKPGRSTSPEDSGKGKLQIPKGMSSKDFLMMD